MQKNGRCECTEPSRMSSEHDTDVEDCEIIVWGKPRRQWMSSMWLWAPRLAGCFTEINPLQAISSFLPLNSGASAENST